MLDRIHQMVWKHVSLTEHPEHAVEIATIISLWNSTEDVVANYLELFFALEMGFSTALISSMQSSKAKVDFLSAAGAKFLAHDNELLQEFSKLINTLLKRIKQRNTYAHAIYVTNINEPGSLYMSDRTDNPFDISGYTKVSLHDLKSQVKLMVNAFDSSILLYNKIYDRTPRKLLDSIGMVRLYKKIIADGHDLDKFGNTSS